MTSIAAAQETSTTTSEPVEATITTDQFDYAPNTVVTFTGSGWLPGETVEIVISQSDGDPDAFLYAIADAEGLILNSEFSTAANDEGVEFGVVATGQVSGKVAATGFVDNHFSISLNPSSFLEQNAPVSLNVHGNYRSRFVSCFFSGCTTTNISSSDHHVFISGPGLPMTELAINFISQSEFNAISPPADFINVTIPSGIATQPGTYQVLVRMDIFSTSQFCPFFGFCSFPSFSVTDNDFSSPAFLTILEVNDPPTVSAGGPYNASEGGSVLVTALGTDPEGRPLSYAWDLDNNGSFETPGQAVTFSAATIDGLATRTINARVIDTGGLVDTDSTTVTITNVAPTPDAGGPYSVDEGSTVELSGSGTDPAPADVLTLAWDLDNNGTFEAAGQSPIFNAAGLDNGAYPITLRVCDDDGGCATDPGTVNVGNSPPVVTLLGSATADEGDLVSYNYSWTDPGTGDTFPALGNSVSCGPKGTVSNQVFTPLSKTGSFDCTFTDDSGAGTFAVSATVTDDDGAADSDTVNVDVDNVAPTLGAITAPVDPVAAGTAVNISAEFTDPGPDDTHTCNIDWGDSPPADSSGDVTEPSSPGSCTKSHAYLTPGVYTIVMTLSDDDGGSGTSHFQYVVIYDPDAGFVTGGGWFNSPLGAYTPDDPSDPDLIGKATFGFVSKYRRGATTPDGNTEFQFHAAKLNFKSTSYEWLVIAGPKAQYKGRGTINGAGDYRFILTANDGQVSGGGGLDKLRIKIWDSISGAVIYDNQAAYDEYSDATDAIENGSIVIHKR